VAFSMEQLLFSYHGKVQLLAVWYNEYNKQRLWLKLVTY
jgi:hypothetical protein